MDSKRIVGVVMLCAACLFGVLISTAYFSTQEMDEVPYWWKGMRVTGTVMDITKDTIKVRLEDKKEMTFSINPLTKISILGRTSLENGNLVRITYKPLNEKTTPQPARWIREISKQGDTGEHSANSRTHCISRQQRITIAGEKHGSTAWRNKGGSAWRLIGSSAESD